MAKNLKEKVFINDDFEYNTEMENAKLRREKQNNVRRMLDCSYGSSILGVRSRPVQRPWLS